MKKSVADAIGRRCADIYITAEHIRHIETKHAKELEKLGFGGLQYAKMIVEQYNQICSGSGTSILLVVATASRNHTAAIDMNYCTKKGVWEIRTAQPRSMADIQKRKLLWKRG